MSSGRIAAVLVAGMILPGWGSSQPMPRDRYEITAQQIVQALAGRGIQTGGLQVTLLARVVSSEPGPELEVLTIEPRKLLKSEAPVEASYMVKLGCQTESACLPFYAVVSQREATAGSLIGSTSLVSASRSAKLKPDAMTIHAGAHAVLLMDDGNAQIEVAVVSLESGAAGNKIHVTSLDHKQVYLAKVVSATLLTRSF